MKSTLYILFFSAILCSSFTCKKETKTEVYAINKTKGQIERDSIAAYAKNFLGTPYVYAGSDPEKGFDCSGFVSYVFHHFDVNLPRSSGEYKNIGKKLNPEDFKVGDILVFYGYKDKTIIGHLGIICEANGMQSKFIHASSGKVNSVTITSLDTEHYTNRFYKCIDVLSK
ncbi:C40 family peptidase [Flavobacterium sp. JLP]|uniref:C40 family peptidase n=1 Tax=unclassified Flavobacterium TaxID=196869 RepID=UPI00188D4FB6|nr:MULTISPECIES: C40 family peptidase [unclassified Flavobacterium]MBF4493498.1 C40 family peptidase [Flavobacterium sp. MR2016-29]MBF4508011.1 C40 family peptidase [Flavobacterium sp. JLP]